MKDFIKFAKGYLSGTMIRQDWIALASLLVGAALVIGVYGFGVRPQQLQTAKELGEENERVFEVLEDAREKSQKLDKLEADTLEVELLVKEFEDRLPTSREIETLVKEFEMMAYATDVKFDFASLPTKSDENKETIPYSIVAKGNFHQLATFINKLELFKRYIKITNLEITAQVENVATATFTLNTYRFLQSGS